MKNKTGQLDMFMASIDNEVVEEKKPEEVLIDENLTPRQIAVWELIEHNSLRLFRKTSQREIYKKVKGFEWNDEPTAHDHCPAIWNDIKDCNESPYHDKIIISKNFEYWIGSKKETEQYIRFLWNAISPRLKRYWNIVKKTKLDGTGRMFKGDKHDDNMDAMCYFIEAFNKYDVEMQNNAEEGGNEKKED